MPLTKTINEVQEMLPNFISNLSKVSSLPVFSQAEYKYLVPITGLALYNDIHGKYNGNENMSDTEQALLKKMRLVAVAFAYADSLATGIIKLGDNGAKKVNPNDTTPVAKWEFEKTQTTLVNIGNDAIEVLLQYLFEKRPELWIGSNEYKSLNSLLIKTGTDFSKQYKLFQPMRTFFYITNRVADAQESYLEEGIGAQLLTHLLSIETPDESLSPVIQKLKKSLAFYSIKECCEHERVRFSIEGFTVLSQYGSNDSADHAGRQSASAADIETVKAACDSKGSDFLNKAKFGLVEYYSRTSNPVASNEFKQAFMNGPLKGYTDPVTATSGNEKYKGIFRL